MTRNGLCRNRWGYPTLVAIDRAGFIRRVEKPKNFEQAGVMMQQIGDTTPKLEVGKPAPISPWWT
jgi:hypothetical protein